MTIDLRIALAAAAALVVARPAEAAPRVAGCINPQDLGADPADSASDDAAAIRSAIAAARAAGGARVVCLPGGVYNLLTTVTVSGSQVAFDLSGATDLSIAGEGVATILKLGNIAQTSVQVFYVAAGAARVRFSDLSVDATAQPGATAATSLFRIGDGATAVSDVALDAIQAIGSGGSGVVIEGSTSATTITQVAIRNARFAGNKSAAIKVLEGVDRVAVTTSYFSNNTGIEIDVTQGARTMNGLAITNNMIIHPAASAQPLAIRVDGLAPTASQNLVIADNVVLGGRLLVRGFAQVAVAGNTIIGGTQATDDPELLVGNRTSSISVTTNAIRRTSCTSGHVVQIGLIVDGLRAITLVDNAIVQAAIAGQNGCPSPLPALPAVQLGPTNQLIMTGNHVGFASAAPAVNAVVIGPAVVEFSHLTVANNTVEGPSLAAAFEMGTGNGLPPQMIFTDNISRGATTGVQVDSTNSGFIPMIANNRFDGATTAIALAGGSPAVAIRGNGVGPLHFTGAGSPEARISAPIGSLYFQTDATSHGLWVKESGTSNTGWHSKN